MSTKSIFLTNTAHGVVAELSQHPVLRSHWEQLSVIMKGSTARGNADRYSDIDLVMYCDERVRKTIVDGYYKAGLTQRRDGIFMFFDGKGYDGHYHVESFDQLAGYFRDKDFIHIWESQNVVPLHDPGGRFTEVVTKGTQTVFADPLAHIKRAYLDLQLDLDWMRHPLRRGDGLSAFLHCAKIVQGLCRLCYLLDARPYPPDKWLIHYLGTTRFGKQQRRRITAYGYSSSKAQTLPKHLTLMEYPLYADGAALIEAAGQFIQRVYGVQDWLQRWYNYV
ncbi:MAG: nucleotidyltransferase domain-containing protein [Chloroflexi bacterium]|nr:nucleotidyltransferase domain-containing protein [Chloroflexota bacterium]